MPVITSDKFASIIDGTWRGVDYYIICPFHDDHHESMKIFPTIDRASWCWACAKFAWWDEIISTKLNISIAEAKRKLGDTRTTERTKDEGRKAIYHNFCSEYPDYDLSSIFATTLPLPQNAKDFLESKNILENAMRLQWRWVDGTIRGWTKGIVIPYFEDGRVAYMRFRRQEQRGFSKPIGPKSISPRPYYLWSDYSDVVYITEGESDALSCKENNVSVIGIPGATQIQCINSAIAEASNRGIKNIVIVGDNDQAGEDFVARIKRSMLYLSDMKATTLIIPAEYNDANDLKVAGRLIVCSGANDKKRKEEVTETIVRIFGNNIKKLQLKDI